MLLESYTSILTVGKDVLEQFYGRELIVADRELCESNIDEILKEAQVKEIALLVVGDPLGATTHTDMLIRAKQMNVETQIVHNASIMNAVSSCGLQLYNFGETVSIPYWTETWRPDSFFQKIVENYKRNLHTLCLLDIKVKEPTEESLTKKVRQYMDPRFMSVAEAAKQIIHVIENNSESGKTLYIRLALSGPVCSQKFSSHARMLGVYNITVLYCLLYCVQYKVAFTSYT